MTELALKDLAEIYDIFSKQGIEVDRIWSLTKKDLDELNIPYHLLKRYLQCISSTGNISVLEKRKEGNILSPEL